MNKQQGYTPQEWIKAFGLISPIGLIDREGTVCGISSSELWLVDFYYLLGEDPLEKTRITLSTNTIVNHLLTALTPLVCGGIKFKFAKADFDEVYFGHGIKGLTPKLFKLAQPALAKLINQDTYTKTANGWEKQP